MLLAIDVGTSNSSAAMPVNGTPTAIKVGAEDYAVPSAVLVDESGGLLIGSAAVNRRVSAPERFKDNFKRDFGMGKSYELGGVTVTPEEIYEAYFRFFKEGCEQTGAVADEVTITHPANFSDRKKGILSDIIKNVFLLDGDKIRLIEEPKAALYTFPTENMKPDDIVVVYDLGGGTLDVALARITAGGLITVEGYEGTDLGGTDFDSLIRRDIIEKLGISNERLKNNRLKQLLLDIPVKAKHALSVTEDCSLTISLDYDDYSVTRADFNQMLEPLMDRSDELIGRLLENTGYDKEDITRVMCVGGSSCVPYVLERVEKAMGMRPLTSPKPDLAVCLGATEAGGFTKEHGEAEEENAEVETEAKVEAAEVNSVPEIETVEVSSEPEIHVEPEPEPRIEIGNEPIPNAVTPKAVVESKPNPEDTYLRSAFCGFTSLIPEFKHLAPLTIKQAAKGELKIFSDRIEFIVDDNEKRYKGANRRLVIMKKEMTKIVHHPLASPKVIGIFISAGNKYKRNDFFSTIFYLQEAKEAKEILNLINS